MRVHYFTLLILGFLSTQSFSQSLNVEVGIDRPGADYRNFDIDADYRICRNACERDAACQAYTYVHPGVQGPKARCWLKSAAPKPIASGCCYSGVKPITRERGWDRPGSDFRNFALPLTATAEDCASSCRSDTRCVAYTFVHPNFQGTYPRCWLKNAVPRLVANSCCESGVLRDRN